MDSREREIKKWSVMFGIEGEREIEMVGGCVREREREREKKK